MASACARYHGKPAGSFAVNPSPRLRKTVALIILYPTPWIVPALTVCAVHHLIVAPIGCLYRQGAGRSCGTPVGFAEGGRLKTIRATELHLTLSVAQAVATKHRLACSAVQ